MQIQMKKEKIIAFDNGAVYMCYQLMVNISEKTGKELYKEYIESGGYSDTGKWFVNWCIDKGYCREETEDDVEYVTCNG